jgi:hypothetical protein
VRIIREVPLKQIEESGLRLPLIGITLGVGLTVTEKSFASPSAHDRGLTGTTW